MWWFPLRAVLYLENYMNFAQRQKKYFKILLYYQSVAAADTIPRILHKLENKTGSKK